MTDELEHDAPGWTDRQRDDGAMVMKNLSGNWLVIMPDGRQPLATCPCCRKPFRNILAAQRVANHTYPLVS